MASKQEKKFKRDLGRLKKNDGLLTKLGTGKVGRYGKAAMLTAGILAPGGPSGLDAFKEGDELGPNNNNKVQSEQVVSEQEKKASQNSSKFYTPENPSMNVVNFSDLSNASSNDQSTIKRQLGKDKLQAKKEVEQRNNDKKIQLKAKAGPDNESKKQVDKMANEAVKKTWMVGHEAVEETLIANFYLLPILGPIYLLLLVARPLLAMMGLLVIKVKGVRVKMIPGYSLNEFFLRAKGATIIILITALEWAIILFAIYVFTHPFSAAWEFIKGFFDIAASYK
ncbi:MAG: hypothetical protein ACNFW9_06385 [Candidatus Kerfeldbacteria bacterium]